MIRLFPYPCDQFDESQSYGAIFKKKGRGLPDAYKLSKIINEYFNILVTNAIAGKPTSLAENVNYQTLIVNAMRAELGVSAIELEQVQFVKAPIER